MEDSDELCPRCGQVKFSTKNGEVTALLCKCNWKQGYIRRLAKSVGVPYHRTWPKNWDPEIFKGKCSLPNFVSLQKSAAMIKLWQFSFRKTKLTNGSTNHALLQSIEANRNLFIRGPAGSGRGLLAASIKKLAAGKEISMTPLPSEFDIFKMEAIEASQYSKRADDMRVHIETAYVDPQILILENIKAEIQIKKEGPSQFQTRRRFKASDIVDSVFTRRMLKPGIIVATSSDFLGEVMDDYGERVMDVFNDSKTTLILLLSLAEIEEVKTALVDRISYMNVYVNELSQKKGGDKPSRLDVQSKLEQLALVEEGLYLYFGLKNTIQDFTMERMKHGLCELACFHSATEYDRQLIDIVLRIREESKQKTETYKKAVDQAIQNAIRSKKSLGSRLSEKESLEIARLLSRSDNDKDVAELTKKANELAIEMSGSK